MKKTDWKGIHSVVVTPFKEDGSIDFQKYAGLIQSNIKNGADGIIVAGSTGEFYALTIEERAELFKVTVESAAKKVPVLAGVADLQNATITKLCKHAEETGCNGILALPPIYAKPDVRETETFFRRVAGATKLPVMLYNSPGRIGISLPISLVDTLAKIDNVVAIKDSSADIVHLTELCATVKDRLAVFVGYETMIRAALPVGCTGVVAMAHQLAGRLVRRYYDAAVARDIQTMDRIEPALFAIYRCFKVGSYYAGIKSVMTILGQPVGAPREPLLPYTNEQLDAVRSILTSAKVAQTISSLD